MIFFKILSFFLFINLHNSFKHMNYMFGKRVKLYMGCDYYVEQKLSIYYNDNSIYSIELCRDKRYYHEIYDEDDVNIDDNTIESFKDISYYHEIYEQDYDNSNNEDYDNNEDDSNITSEPKYTLWQKLKHYHLQSRTKPIVVYTNNSFVNTYLSDKYKAQLEFEMMNNDYYTWDDIREIVLLEQDRYER